METRALTAAAVVLLGLPVAASADPFFSIGEGTGTSWTDALNSGLIRAVDPGAGDVLTGAAQAFYTASAGAGNFALVPSELTPDISTNLESEVHQALVMQWNPPQTGENLAIAAWQYDYGVDPDLSNPNVKIHFSLGVPPDMNNPTLPAIWDVSIELIDHLGRARGWFLSMPPVGWSQWWLSANVGAQQGWAFHEDPGFDITQVVSVRLDEASTMSPAFPLPPPGTPQTFWDWNAWDHLTITPEPAALPLLVIFAAGASRRRRGR